MLVNVQPSKLVVVVGLTLENMEEVIIRDWKKKSART